MQFFMFLDFLALVKYSQRFEQLYFSEVNKQRTPQGIFQSRQVHIHINILNEIAVMNDHFNEITF